MGAEAEIHIFDGDAITKDGRKEEFFEYFNNAYERKIFGRTVFTTYGDNGTLHLNMNNDDYNGYILHGEDIRGWYKYIIAEWEVWT